jgi:hypothetical protein
MGDKLPHESYARLLEVATLCHVSEADIPGALGLTPARVGMWRYRGVSMAGAIKAAGAFGCSATYIADGAGQSAKSPGHQVAAIEEALGMITDKQTRFQAWRAALNTIASYAPEQSTPPAGKQTSPDLSGKQRASHR